MIDKLEQENNRVMSQRREFTVVREDHGVIIKQPSMEDVAKDFRVKQGEFQIETALQM